MAAARKACEALQEEGIMRPELCSIEEEEDDQVDNALGLGSV